MSGNQNPPLFDPAGLRQEYRLASLDAADLPPGPMAWFQRWYEDAGRAGIVEPNAMTLSTAGADGAPASRVVLLKGLDAAGFTFFTNYESRKGGDLAVNPRAALGFFWKELERQVNITGVVEKVSREESAEYFHSRPRASQLGAHASVQSAVIPDRAWLEARFAALEAEYPPGAEIPLPDCWGGYRLAPDTVEFWQGRPSRLHDRLRYTRAAASPAGWKIERLSP